MKTETGEKSVICGNQRGMACSLQGVNVMSCHVVAYPGLAAFMTFPRFEGAHKKRMGHLGNHECDLATAGRVLRSSVFLLASSAALMCLSLHELTRGHFGS